MLILTCPCCGVAADETELAPGGEAHLERFAVGSSDADFESYLFHRKNPKGVHFERWRHVNGCGKWFHAARCTNTLEVFGAYKAQTTEPPKDILDTIRAKPAAERLRRLGGSKRPVIDVISVSEKFERAVQYAVGDTVVCDTLSEARQLAFHSGEERYKVGRAPALPPPAAFAALASVEAAGCPVLPTLNASAAHASLAMEA